MRNTNSKESELKKIKIIKETGWMLILSYLLGEVPQPVQSGGERLKEA